MKKLLVILGMLVVVCLVAACGGGKKEKEETEEQLDWSVVHDDIDHQGFYMTLVQKGVGRYVTVAKWPWDAESYHFTDYDDSKSGCIVSVTEPLEIKGMPEKQTAIVIFSTDGENYTIHSVSVGDKIYQDDGKLQSILDKLNGN